MTEMTANRLIAWNRSAELIAPYQSLLNENQYGALVDATYLYVTAPRGEESRKAGHTFSAVLNNIPLLSADATDRNLSKAAVALRQSTINKLYPITVIPPF